MKHIVGISGGIDSQACALWVRQRFPKEDVILVNSDAGGNEHPLTTEHLHWYSENVHPVVFLSPIVADLGEPTGRSKFAELRQQYRDDDPMPFDLMCQLKGGFPSQRSQYCTEYLKLRPLLRWWRSQEPFDGGVQRYIGVRADESAARSNMPETQWNETFDCELHRPLLTWTKQQCFDFVLGAGEQINELYRMGFSRVGCAPCVNSNKDDIRNWAARFPEMIDKIRVWEQRVGKTFFRPVKKGGPLMWIDDMVSWSRTAHGGKQLELPLVEADAEAGMCSSKYGLCE